MIAEPGAVDLPVAWWVFWLVVMVVGVFVAFAWWITRVALREDRTPRSDHGDEGPHGASGEGPHGASGTRDTAGAGTSGPHDGRDTGAAGRGR